jgi:hypothetical protein
MAKEHLTKEICQRKFGRVKRALSLSLIYANKFYLASSTLTIFICWCKLEKNNKIFIGKKYSLLVGKLACQPAFEQVHLPKKICQIKTEVKLGLILDSLMVNSRSYYS